ncbi:MAG TPA: hypothetical protein VGD91_24910 [Trebonia sp.]
MRRNRAPRRPADVQLFWGEPLDGVRARIERLRALSGEAWADAEAKLADMARAAVTHPLDPHWQAAASQRRLLRLASRGEVLDDNLYTAPGKFGAGGAATTCWSARPGTWRSH